jgi:hypothetical protein
MGYISAESFGAPWTMAEDNELRARIERLERTLRALAERVELLERAAAPRIDNPRDQDAVRRKVSYDWQS